MSRTSKTAGKVARRAATLIRQCGWRQGDWLGADGSVCIRGAFNLTVHGHVAHSPGLAEQQFAKWLSRFEELEPVEGIVNLAFWNDAKGRTQDEVLNYLDKFAEEYDPQPAIGEAR